MGRWLKLSGSEYASGHAGSSKRTRKITANKSGLGKDSQDGGEDGFEMASSSRHGYGVNTKFHHHATIRTGPSPTSSEERIIAWSPKEKGGGGVLKTTEVSVS